MSEGGARIRSVESLRPFRAALLVFCREVSSVLSAAEAEIARTIDWLERDRVAHWKGEAQRRGEMLARAKSDLYRAQIQKKSLVDEKKAINRAKAALADAEQRLEAARKWAVRLQHDRALYAGAVQGLTTAVSIDLPKAASILELMSRSLDDYLAMSAALAEQADDAPATVREAMSRGGPPGTGSGMPEEAEVIRVAREMLPGLIERESAPAAEAAGVSLGSRRVSRKTIETDVGGPAPDDGERVIIDARALREELLLLVRDGETLPGDSGWFVCGAPSLKGEPRLVAATIGALREAWPELAVCWAAGPETVFALEGERLRVLRDRGAASGTITPEQEDPTP